MFPRGVFVSRGFFSILPVHTRDSIAMHIFFPLEIFYSRDGGLFDSEVRTVSSVLQLRRNLLLRCLCAYVASTQSVLNVLYCREQKEERIR